MPRLAQLSAEKIITTLEELPGIFDSSGKLVTATHSIWKQASSLLEDKLTPKYLHCFVQQNRHDALNTLRSHFSLPDVDFKLDEKSIFSSDESEHSSEDQSCDEGKRSETEIKQILNISSDEWLQMKPTNTQGPGNKRSYPSLRKNVWTHIISKNIWAQLKIPCPFVFKRAKILEDQSRYDNYCTFKGRCNECSNEVRGYIKHKPEDDSAVTVQLFLRDTKNIPHQTKRPLKGEIRHTVGEELRHTSAKVWRVKSANTDMLFDDVLPPHMYSSDVLRKAKQETREKYFGCKYELPIIGLSDMKNDSSWKNSIKDIGLDRFFVHYWTQTQMLIYKQYCKQSKHSLVSIDATGSLIQKVKKLQGGLSSHIYLYEVVIHFHGKQFPVSQMLSERQDTFSILYWLGQWIKDGAPIPKESVCDYSLALLGAISRAFNSVSLTVYMEECMKSLQLKKKLPTYICTFIRLDVAHLMNMVSKWPCFKNCARKVKEFFLHLIAVLVNVEKIETFENIVLDVLIVSSNETIGQMKGEFNSTPAFHSKKRLLHCISFTELIPEDLNYQSKDLKQQNSPEEILPSENLKTWINELDEKAQANLAEGEEINPFYVPEFSKHFKRLLQSFVLWSGVLRETFSSNVKRGSSAPVESDFSDIKGRMLQGENAPIRVDFFLKMHLNHLEGSLKIARADINALEAQPHEKDFENERNKEDSSEKTAEIEAEEIWKRKNTNKRSKYFSNCPAKKLILLSSESAVPQKFIKNGNVCPPVTIGREIVSIKNTCPVDSIVYSLYSASLDNKNFERHVKNSMNNTLKLVSELQASKSMKKFYTQRANHLMSCYAGSESCSIPNALVIDAYDNVVRYVDSNFKDEPSKTEVRICKECKGTKLLTYPVLRVSRETLLYEGVRALQKALDENINSSKEAFCRREGCEGVQEISPKFGPHVFIELDVLDSANTQLQRKLHPDASMRDKPSLEDFPIQLSFQNTSYALASVIAYQPGHYVSYCYRKNSVWELFNDLKDAVESCREDVTINPHLALYIKA